MEWSELRKEVQNLKLQTEATPTSIASKGANLIYRVLSEMYVGEPEYLRKIAYAICQASPHTVALRNVGVAVYRTAAEARTGNRMAAAARAAQRLTRLINETPKALGRRGQPLIEEGSTIATYGFSSAVQEAINHGVNKISKVVEIQNNPTSISKIKLKEDAPSQFIKIDTSNIFTSDEKIDSFLVGCTAFLADGSMVAELGTYKLVELFFERNINVHFFADTLKLAPWLPSTSSNSSKWDIIPAKFVDHVITEDGIRRPPQLLQAAADLAPMWRRFEEGSNSEFEK
jgi:translation initiation factor 2B subunit (eIF-2B alpha/beta/delta family)